jgi:hypothetical protein
LNNVVLPPLPTVSVEEFYAVMHGPMEGLDDFDITDPNEDGKRLPAVEEVDIFVPVMVDNQAIIIDVEAIKRGVF